MEMLGRVVAYQEDNRNVQSESNCCVQEQSDESDVVDVTHSHFGYFDKKCDDTIDDGAGRCVVVKRDKRVHFELGRRQDALHHDKSDSLEHDSSHLDCGQS